MNDEEIQQKLQRERLSLAPISKRAWAFFIDEMIMVVLFSVIYWEAFNMASTIEQIIKLVNNLVIHIALLKVAYQSLFVWMYGATLGKIVMKIRVLSLDLLDNPNPVFSILRAIVRVLGEWVLYLGFIWGLMTPLKQTWQDKAARTIVVNA